MCLPLFGSVLSSVADDSSNVKIRSIVAVSDLIGLPLGSVVFSHWGFEGILVISLPVLTVDLILRL